MVEKCGMKNYREVSKRITLPRGNYCIVPCCKFFRGDAQDYLLRILIDCPEDIIENIEVIGQCDAKVKEGECAIAAKYAKEVEEGLDFEDHAKCNVCAKSIKDQGTCLVMDFNTESNTYDTKLVHDDCFICSGCKISIGTRIYYIQDRSPYCYTCYKDRFDTCELCKEPLDGRYYTKDEKRLCVNCYNKEFNSCEKCSEVLKKYIEKDGKRYCKSCYLDVFAKKCSYCHEPIQGL